MKIKTLDQIKKLINEDPKLKKKISSIEVAETNEDGSLVVLTWFKLPYWNEGSGSGYIHSESIGEWKQDMKAIRRINCKEDLNEACDVRTSNYNETCKLEDVGTEDPDKLWEIIKPYVENKNI